jgi:hypothetical protein
MEAEHRKTKEIKDHEERRKNIKLESDLKTTKKSFKRKMKKEKKKILKQFGKEAQKFNACENDGTFLEKIKEKYGEDVLDEKEKKRLAKAKRKIVEG